MSVQSPLLRASMRHSHRRYAVTSIGLLFLSSLFLTETHQGHRKKVPKPPLLCPKFLAINAPGREAELTTGFPFKARRKAVKTRHRTPMMGTIAAGRLF